MPGHSSFWRTNSFCGGSESRFGSLPPQKRDLSGQFRLIGAGDRAEADGEAVPAVDLDHSEGEVRHLFLREMGADPLIYLVGDVIMGDQRQRLGPFQGGALAICIERT